MSQQPVPTSAPISLTRRVDLLLALEALEAGRPRALGVVALVDLGVGITQLNGNIPLQLVLETDRLHLRNGLDNGRLSVSDVSDGSDVNGRLTRDNLGGQGRKCGQVEGVWVGLFGQLWSLGLRRDDARLLHGGLGRLLLLGFLLERLLLLNVVVAVRIQHGRTQLGLIVGKTAVSSHGGGMTSEKSVFGSRYHQIGVEVDGEKRRE